jgi:RHS repeat-associated protein
MTSIDTYDEYGIPAATNQGTFQYAGMMWLSRPGLYAPAFRSFNALLGRFNQTDPIGFGGGINLYGYTGGDPVNGTDPLGLTQDTSPQEIVVNACENGGVPDANGTCSSPELIPTFLTFGDTAIRVPPGYNCPSGFCTINVTGRRLTNNNKSLPNLTLQQQQKPRYCSTPAYKIGDFLRKTSEAGKHIAAIGAFAGLVQEGAAPVTAGGSAVTGTGTLALAGGAYLISASIGVVGSFLTQSASQQSKSNYESYAFATSALSFGGGLVQPTAMALADVATGNVTKSGAGENPCGD